MFKKIGSTTKSTKIHTYYQANSNKINTPGASPRASLAFLVPRKRGIAVFLIFQHRYKRSLLFVVTASQRVVDEERIVGEVASEEAAGFFGESVEPFDAEFLDDRRGLGDFTGVEGGRSFQAAVYSFQNWDGGLFLTSSLKISSSVTLNA